MRFLSIVMVTLMLLGTSGCGTIIGVLIHFVDSPEASPPLGEPFSAGQFGEYPDAYQATAFGSSTFSGSDAEVSGSQTVVTPATDATMADLAGTWVHSDGWAAVHIDDSGQIFQVDLSEEIHQYLGSDDLPLTVFNMGTTSISLDGEMVAKLEASVPPVHASGIITATLDSTHNVLYAAFMELTLEYADSSDAYNDYSTWLRWDPETGTLAIDN